jgi:hypothetical protein
MNKPQMEFPSNVPQTVELVKMFKHGQNDHGEYYAWEFKHEGVSKVYFAKEALQKKLVEFKAGQTVVVNFEEKKGEKGKFHVWNVKEALFDEKGRAPKQSPPDITKSEPAYKTYRENRVRLMKENLQDAATIAQGFNEWLGKQGNGEWTRLMLDHSDVRAIAVSFGISYERKTA